MRESDRWAIEDKRIPVNVLMERAGEGLARVIATRAPAGRIAIVCGKGNNGGDGVGAARLLRPAGRGVGGHGGWARQWMLDDAAEQVRKLPGPPPVAFDAERLGRAHVIVDAVLGTGSRGEPRDPAAAVIEAINAAKAPVVAADVPSGVDASTGEVAGEAVRAVATATFHAGKPGLFIHPGKAYAGDVEVIDIGIPRGALVKPQAGLIGGGVLRDVPRRGAASTK